ncbi:MAG: diguanylate cyclase [Nitrospirae bacterium]|nr:diguanylate cyclase [Candidatus Manganitrophaceae bacterium]
MSLYSQNEIHIQSSLQAYRKRLIYLSASVYIFSLFLIFAVSRTLPPEQVSWPGVIFILVSGIFSILALIAVPWHRLRPDWLLIMAFLSVVKIRLLISVTGESASPFFSLYLFVIILSGAFFTGLPLLSVVLSVVVVSANGFFFGPRPHFDLQYLLSISVYAVAALVTNLLLKDLYRKSDQAQRAAEQLETLYEASQLLHTEPMKQLPFGLILELGRRATRARSAILEILDETGHLLCFSKAGPSAGDSDSLEKLRLDLRPFHPVGWTDPPEEAVEEVFSESKSPWTLHVGEGHLELLILEEKPIGRICVADKWDGAPFSAEDQIMLVRLSRDIAIEIEKRRLLKKIQTMVITDELTGLSNHRHFYERSKDEIERASRYLHCCSLLIIDVDDFKPINDTYGHPAGDAALKEIARTIQAAVRNTDLCARYGGDEFTVVLPETTKEATQNVAEHLRAAVAGLHFESGGKEIPLSLSIGMATYPEDATDLTTLIAAADAALYHSKRMGKNRISAL